MKTCLVQCRCEDEPIFVNAKGKAEKEGHKFGGFDAGHRVGTSQTQLDRYRMYRWR